MADKVAEGPRHGADVPSGEGAAIKYAIEFDSLVACARKNENLYAQERKGEL